MLIRTKYIFGLHIKASSYFFAVFSHLDFFFALHYFHTANFKKRQYFTKKKKEKK